MIVHSPPAGNVLCGTRNTAGTIITIPPNNVWSGNLVISASVALAATATPSVTVSGTGGGPASGTIVHRLSITGLALTTVSDSCMTEVIVVSGDNPLTLEFAVGGASSATVTATGFLL